MTFGLGVRMSSLGAGLEAAVGFNEHMGVRVGGNLFQYSRSFTNNGITYPTTLMLRSAQATFDWFPFGGQFHISPGVMYSGSQATASPTVPTGSLFELDGATYRSGATPVSGWAKATLNPAAPVLLVGWGNLAHRTKHVIFSVEGGVAYSGAPKVTLGLGGTICDPGGTYCRALSSDQAAVGQVRALQLKLQHNASPFVVYPIFVIGLGYRF
jgi:hypothetical protein